MEQQNTSDFLGIEELNRISSWLTNASIASVAFVINVAVQIKLRTGSIENGQDLTRALLTICAATITGIVGKMLIFLLLPKSEPSLYLDNRTKDSIQTREGKDKSRLIIEKIELDQGIIKHLRTYLRFCTLVILTQAYTLGEGLSGFADYILKFIKPESSSILFLAIVVNYRVIASSILLGYIFGEFSKSKNSMMNPIFSRIKNQVKKNMGIE